MSDQLLSGLVVLDLSQYIAGPFCTKLLADYGAEVIKIEPPGTGDVARSRPPFFHDEPHPEKSGLFLFLNTNKKSITLNVESAKGQDVLRRLVGKADILVESFAPGYLDSLDLGYEALAETNPALVVTSVSYFGQTGPYRDYKGSDIVIYALGGLMYFSGDPDREPLLAGGSQAEYQTGLNAAVATMTSLYFRDEAGLGQQADVSAMESMASILEGAAMNYAYQGHFRRRAGTRHHTNYPSTILPCKDGHVHIHSSGDWEGFAHVIGEPQLLDPEFAGAQRQHADEIDALIQPHLSERSRDEIFHEAQTFRQPLAKIMSIDEVLADPHYRERGFFAEVDHPVTGKLLYPGAPFRPSEAPYQAGRAPLLGEHNEEVYCRQLGLTAEELSKLKEEGVV